MRATLSTLGGLTGKATDKDVPSRATMRVITARVRKATYSLLVGFQSGKAESCFVPGGGDSLPFSTTISLEVLEGGIWASFMVAGGEDIVDRKAQNCGNVSMQIRPPRICYPSGLPERFYKWGWGPSDLRAIASVLYLIKRI